MIKEVALGNYDTAQAGQVILEDSSQSMFSVLIGAFAVPSAKKKKCFGFQSAKDMRQDCKGFNTGSSSKSHIKTFHGFKKKEEECSAVPLF